MLRLVETAYEKQASRLKISRMRRVHVIAVFFECLARDAE
jgi:hypothetical protein